MERPRCQVGNNNSHGHCSSFFGYVIRTEQKLLEHKSVEVTMIYADAMTKPGLAVRSSLDD
jgi:hypothetical protein